MPTRVFKTATVLICLFMAAASAEGPGIMIKSLREIREESSRRTALAPAEIRPVIAESQPIQPPTQPQPAVPYVQPAIPPQPFVPYVAPRETMPIPAVAQPPLVPPVPVPTEILPGPSAQPAMLPMGQPRERSIDADRPIAAVRTVILPAPGALPQNLAQQRFAGESPAFTCRPWESLLYNWDAPDLCYGALRYEEVNLERLGYTYHPLLQPGISAAHFVGSTLALPYSLALHPPSECIYPLGHYRPGSPAPYQWHWPENSLKAHGFQCGTVAALIFLIP